LQLTEQCLPISVEYAKAIGLIDDIIIQDGGAPSNFTGFQEQIVRIAEKLAQHPELAAMLDLKRQTRAADEKAKPLQQYRLEELEEMNQNFWGPDPAYHVARSAFVRKQPRPGNGPCSPALMQVCSNKQCDEAIQAGRNRCAFVVAAWPRQRAAAGG
jgi:putative two-component system hydrogenase maturation factor HypX/HoxX